MDVGMIVSRESNDEVWITLIEYSVYCTIMEKINALGSSWNEDLSYMIYFSHTQNSDGINLPCVVRQIFTQNWVEEKDIDWTKYNIKGIWSMPIC